MALQRALCRRSGDDYLLLLEHNHVYTLGSNADVGHMLVDPASVGADMVKADRGGDITYHGPGQLVGYPVISVGRGPHRGPEHVARVEQVIIDALVSLGVDPADVGRLPGFPGVWIGLDATGPEPRSDPDRVPNREADVLPERVDRTDRGSPRKICAVGVRTTRGRTMHGFALNVNPDLSMFSHIVPCGIADKSVTSLSAEGIDVTMAAVTDAVIDAAIAMWGPLEDLQRVTDGIGAVPVTRPLERMPVPAGVPDRVPVLLRSAPTAERSIDRRLRRSGVDPDAGLAIGERKPPWLRVQARMGDAYLGLRRELRSLDLVTVCEEAGCPNIFECWSDGTATFMINGSRCTRACGFCQVDTRHPLALNADEPERVAEAVARMGLAHAVITCVARDDLEDGGAGGFAATLEAVRRKSPNTAVEVLISDCKGDDASLRTIFDAVPDIMNHNIETVARLQRAVRPSAGYARSLAVLARAKDAGLVTKSGMILGMGEHYDEVLATLADLRAVGVNIVTLGQYLRPSSRHVPVDRWWRPEEFDSLQQAGMAMGFGHVQASPLTRSSYHAREAAESTVAVDPAVVPVTMAASGASGGKLL